jgi:16S rRNA C1402 N4-methylase RsmH
VTAAATEVEANPRSRSAKLRGLRRSAAEVRTP